MPTPRHLRNAPITEAIIDFRVKARPDLDVERFRAVHTTLVSLPQLIEMRSIEAQVRLAGGGAPEPSVKHHGIVGFQFKSADGRDIAQFRADGFTYNRLKPYTSWDAIFPRAIELWQLYVRHAAPQMITRLALRYLNRIELPPDLRDFDDIMAAPPPIPRGLPQHLSAFLTRVTLHDVELDLSAHLSQALEADPTRRQLALILDIDAFRQRDIEVGSPVVGETFEALHGFKNRAFFESLTEQAIEVLE